jgi:CDP-diacylglycerol--glycerol-3-phosphate 3-phosphatidyltransferase
MSGIYQVKPAFQRSLGGIQHFLVARDVNPDSLTFAALALSVVGGVLVYFAPETIWLLACVPPLVFVRTMLNALDGLVANETGRARPWGEVLNEMCDRFADVALFGGAALASPSNHLLGAVTVVAMLLNSYLAILSKAAGGRRQYVGPMGKADRMVVLGVAAALGLFLPLVWIYNGMLVVVLLGLVPTMLQRARDTHRDLQPAR